MTVQKKSSPERYLGKTATATKLELRKEAAIPLLQQETQLFQLLQRRNRVLMPDGWPLGAESWIVEFSSVRLSQSFAHTPQGVQHWPGCRYIFS